MVGKQQQQQVAVQKKKATTTTIVVIKTAGAIAATATIMLLLLLMFISTVSVSNVIVVVDAFVLPRKHHQHQYHVVSNNNLLISTNNNNNENTNTNAMTEKKARVKKAGGGIPAGIPPGDREQFWDPSEAGMNGMTEASACDDYIDNDHTLCSLISSLDERLERGTDFTMETYSSAITSSIDSTTSTTSSSSMEDGLNVDGVDLSYHVPTPIASMENTTPMSVVPLMLHASQCWLEHLDEQEPYIPPVFAKASKPVTAVVLGRTSLITKEAPGDIQHIVLKLPHGFQYVEGQSVSVIPPGLTEKGKPQKPRLYSIASTRYGDLLDGSTVSLCVRRAEYTDPGSGVIDPTKAGICSNFLCDSTPGQEITVAGPVGKTMVLPRDSTKDIIMVATGTGIAPFRSFLHRLFMEHTTAKHLFTGTAWLILGVPTTGSLLYKPEFDSMVSQNTRAGKNNLKINYAISREMTNKSNGGKLYVQDVLAENSTELFSRLEKGAVIYFCGLKGMMPGILTALADVAVSQGIDWTTTLKKYQANHQWHVEVY